MAANKGGDIILPYMAAYCTLSKDVVGQQRLTVNTSEQMTPYLEEMKECNTMSVFGCAQRAKATSRLMSIFPFCMNFEPIRQVLDLVNELFQVSSKYLALAAWLGSRGLKPNKS